MGKSEILTMLLQVLAKGLYRNDIELRGNDPKLASDIKTKLDTAFTDLQALAKNIYIRDASTGIPRIADPKDANSIYNTVESLKQKHNAERILVVVDSVQDIVPLTNNQIQAEVQTVQELTEVQQKTGATILVVAQKNKGSINSVDSYGDVMGSMSFIHKPNTVIEIVTAKELLAKSKDNSAQAKEIEANIEADTKDGYAKPMYLNIIKGRYTGTSAIPLQYYGAYGYYEGGKTSKYNDVYDVFKV
jgi:KaiC/GvpD/RAD55 family RecA-like ATPase